MYTIYVKKDRELRHYFILNDKKQTLHISSSRPLIIFNSLLELKYIDYNKCIFTEHYLTILNVKKHIFTPMITVQELEDLLKLEDLYPEYFV